MLLWYTGVSTPSGISIRSAVRPYFQWGKIGLWRLIWAFGSLLVFSASQHGECCAQPFWHKARVSTINQPIFDDKTCLTKVTHNASKCWISKHQKTNLLILNPCSVLKCVDHLSWRNNLWYPGSRHLYLCRICLDLGMMNCCINTKIMKVQTTNF